MWLPKIGTDLFGGKTDNPELNGKFGTAHGITLDPFDNHLTIADRFHGRVQIHAHDGRFINSHKLPLGTWPCGIQYVEFKNRWLAVVGCLYDDVSQTNLPAPIHILDALSHEIVSTIRPKDELEIDLAQHLHNVIGILHNGEFYLICQSWNPGHYFVLQKV